MYDAYLTPITTIYFKNYHSGIIYNGHYFHKLEKCTPRFWEAGEVR